VNQVRLIIQLYWWISWKQNLCFLH